MRKESTRTYSTVLGKFLEIILHDLGVGNKNKLATLVDKYIIREKNSGSPMTGVYKSHILNNITDPGISWKKFQLAILGVLNVKTMRIKIELVHQSDNVTKHNFTIHTNNTQGDEDVTNH